LARAPQPTKKRNGVSRVRGTLGDERLEDRSLIVSYCYDYCRRDDGQQTVANPERSNRARGNITSAGYTAAWQVGIKPKLSNIQIFSFDKTYCVIPQVSK